MKITSVLPWSNVKDVRGNEITEKMVIDLAKSIGVSPEAIKRWIGEGLISHIPCRIHTAS